MSVLKGDKVILIKEFNELKFVGKEYEVANITETSIVLRDVKTKVAIASINIDEFDSYFEKSERFSKWTEWTTFATEGSVIGLYRTNGKKVEVKWNGYKSAAYCSKLDDFSLYFGLTLAYKRCIVKFLKKQQEYHKKMLHVTNGELLDYENAIKIMINSLDEKVVNE